MRSISRAISAAAGLSIAAVAISAAAQADQKYEPMPAMPAAALAPAGFAKGANYDVAEPVRVERFMGVFELRSPHGKFRVSGIDMLGVRVRELRAIEALKKVQSSSAFTDALAKSAGATAKTVGSLVTDPGTTVENIAVGAGTVLGRIGYSIKSGAQNVGDKVTKPAGEQKATAPGGAEPPSFTGDPFGYNKARREWAKKLEIDPYTTNPVLRPLLDNAATATFAGNFAVSVTMGMVGTASDFESTVRESVWNQPPLDLQKANEEKLKRMGVPADTVRAFLRNRWYTPTLQTALVAALENLGGVSGRDSVVRTATSVLGDVPARFLLRSVILLGDYHKKQAPLAKMRMRGIVPIGTAKDGSLVGAADVDYLYWSEEAAAFAAAQELAAPNRTLLIGGQASGRAATELSRARWTLKGGLRPAQGS